MCWPRGAFRPSTAWLHVGIRLSHLLPCDLADRGLKGGARHRPVCDRIPAAIIIARPRIFCSSLARADDASAPSGTANASRFGGATDDHAAAFATFLASCRPML